MSNRSLQANSHGPDRKGKASHNIENPSSKSRLPLLDYNRINGETNIMQFSRALKKYQEQELPALGSAVARFKLPILKKPEPPRLSQTKISTKDANSAAIEALAKQMNTLVQIMIQQNHPIETTTTETTTKSKKKASAVPPPPVQEKVSSQSSEPEPELETEEEEVQADEQSTQASTVTFPTLHSENSNIDEDDSDEESDQETDDEDDKDLSDPDVPPEIKIASYQTRLDHHLTKKELIISQNSTLFGVITSSLSLSSKELIESNSEYARLLRKRDGILLWKLVYKLHKIGPSNQSISEQRDLALSRYYNCFQRSDQDLHAYYQKFADNLSFFKSVGLKKPPKSDTIVRFINSLNREIFGDLQREVHNNPHITLHKFTSLSEAYNYVSNYKHINPSHNGTVKSVFNNEKKLRKDKNQSKPKAEEKSQPKDNHKYCSYHKKNGHSDEECRAQQKKEKNSGNVSDDSCDYIDYQNPNLVILDSGAQISVFHNKDLLVNLREVPQILLSGINKDASPIKCNIQGSLPGLKDIAIYYTPKAKKNLLKLADVNGKYPTTFDSQSKCFSFYNDEGLLIEFPQKFQVYCRIFDGEKSQEIYNSSVTKSEMQNAILARQIAQRLACESDAGLMKILRNGTINDLPISYADIKRANELLGPDIGSIKGKATNKNPDIPRAERISKHHEKIQTLMIDLMYVNDECFLVTVSRPIDLVLVHHLASYGASTNKSKNLIKTALLKTLATYRSEGFHINEIICDAESSFLALENEINAYGARLNHNLSSSHMTAIIDRKIRFIKDRARSVLHSLQFPLPKIFLKWLIFFVVSRINLTPHGDNKISPRELFCGRRTEFKIDLRVSFGEFVQTLKNNTDNTMLSRTEDCIALLPTGSESGSVMFYSIQSKKVITQTKWTPCVMPESIKTIFVDMCKKEQALSKLIPFNYRGKLIEDEDNSEEPLPILRPLSEEYQTILSLPPVIDLQEDPPVEDMIGRCVVKTEDFEDVSDESDEDVKDESDESDEEVTTSISVPEPPSLSISSHDDPPLISLPSEDPPITPLPDEQPLISPSQSLAENDIKTTRSGRKIKPPFIYEPTVNILEVMNISVEQAMQQDPKSAMTSIEKELQQMLIKGVWHPVHQSSLHGIRIIPCKLFLKEKFVEGTKILKSRLVAGGHLQIKTSAKDLFSSPTAHITSIFILFLIIARKRMYTKTADIVGAYLNARMTSDVYMRIPPIIASILTQLDPTYVDYVTRTGAIVVKLDKALYGCIESAKLWFLDISSLLIEIGFKPTTLDECIFIKEENGETTYVSLYVDDLLIASTNQCHIESLEQQLRSKYTDVTVHSGPVHQYLGMTLDFSQQGIANITMHDYIEKILKRFNITSTKQTPYDKDLFEDVEDSPLSPEDAANLHSGIAQLLYLSTRIRGDISLPVNYLCTQVSCLKNDHKEKFMKILQYLNLKKNLSLRLECENEEPTIEAYADAAYGVTQSRHSQSGHVIILGKGAIVMSSHKQKIVTKSSTEAELVAASDIISSITSVKSILTDLKIKIKGIILHQDNLSTIKLINNQRPTSQRSRHIDIRYFFLRDRQLNDHIEIVHTPTEFMIADILTKPLPIKQFNILRNILLNCG